MDENTRRNELRKIIDAGLSNIEMRAQRDAALAEIERLKAEVERLQKALDEMGQHRIYNVATENVRLKKGLDDIIGLPTLEIWRVKDIARAALGKKEAKP